MVHKDKLTAELSSAADNYWDYVPAMIASALRSNRDIDEYIERYRPLIDFGINPLQLAEVRNSLPVIPQKSKSLTILFVSDWMKHFIAVVTKKEEREALLHKEEKVALQMKQLIQDTSNLQVERRRKLDSIFSFNDFHGRSYLQLIESLPKIDAIKFDSLLKNDALSRGKYFGIEERRTLANERQWLSLQERKIEALLSMITDRETRLGTAALFEVIREQLNKQLALRKELDSLAERRYQLDEEIFAIPVEQITGKISEKIMHLKTILTEETSRVGGETGVFRRVKEQIIDIDSLNEELRRIIEFDREIFANNFINKHGLPTVLLVPGKGDGMYDSLDNIIIMPMIPNFNLADSIAAALVAYRLSHDESKQMIRSFSRLNPNTKQSSPYAIRMQLIKSYSKWVNIEYDGYHVLSKNERIWFSHGYAPKRGEFFIPFEMVRGVLHGDKYKELVIRINEGFQNETIKPEELWFASIISCKRSELDKAEMQIKKLLSMSNDYIFAQFNMGVIAVKLNRDQVAIDYFSNFISMKPPKWWAAAAQEYLVALKNQG